MARYIPEKKRFCLRGHDILIVGRYPNGRGSGVCKECGRAKMRKRNTELPYNKEYRKTEKGLSVSRNSRWKHHGILNADSTIFSVLDRDEALLAQESKCKICGIPEIKLGKALAVDHDHSTGIFRGLLCDRCNRGIGYFDDDPKKLEKAAKYFTKINY